jgi:hypothetical protein
VGALGAVGDDVDALHPHAIDADEDAGFVVHAAYCGSVKARWLLTPITRTTFESAEMVRVSV